MDPVSSELHGHNLCSTVISWYLPSYSGFDMLRLLWGGISLKKHTFEYLSMCPPCLWVGPFCLHSHQQPVFVI